MRDGFHRAIMERNEVPEHRTGFVKWAVPVVLAHAILLQEIVLQHTGDLQGDLIVFAQCTLPDELDNLCKIVLLLEDLLRACPEFDETRFRGVVMRTQHLEILGVGQVPVDRREMFPLSEFLVETPEDLHDA